MKIGANLVISCPYCNSTMIIANPTKQERLKKEHKIIQVCNDCKNTIIIYLVIAVTMYEVKPVR